jgi:hypothetical protein
MLTSTAPSPLRSELRFCERLQHDLRLPWFLDMGLDEAPFDPTCFGENRARRE